MVLSIFNNWQHLLGSLVDLERVGPKLVSSVLTPGMHDDVVAPQELNAVLDRALSLLGPSDPEATVARPIDVRNRLRPCGISDDGPLARLGNLIEQIRDAVDLAPDLIGLLVNVEGPLLDEAANQHSRVLRVTPVSPEIEPGLLRRLKGLNPEVTKDPRLGVLTILPEPNMSITIRVPALVVEQVLLQNVGEKRIVAEVRVNHDAVVGRFLNHELLN